MAEKKKADHHIRDGSVKHVKYFVQAITERKRPGNNFPKQEIYDSGKCHHIKAGEARKMSINSVPYKSDLSSLLSSLQALDSNCNNISIKLQSLSREMLWTHVFSWEQF